VNAAKPKETEKAPEPEVVEDEPQEGEDTTLEARFDTLYTEIDGTTESSVSKTLILRQLAELKSQALGLRKV
jgi:hypothetical protein